MSIIVGGSCVGAVLSPIIFYSIYCIYSGNLNVSTWYFPFAMELPFDKTTVFGWYMQPLNYAIGSGTSILTISTVVPYFVSGCLYINACCKHFQSVFDKFEEIICTEYDETRDKTAALNRRFSEQMSAAISLHAKIMK